MTVPVALLFGGFWLVAFTFAVGAKSTAPWVRTLKKQRELLVRDFPLPENATVYDLGCGDGSVLFSLAEANPSMKGVGFEISMAPLLIGWSKKLLGGEKYRHVYIRPRDFFGQHFADADVVFLFLMEAAYPKVMRKLAAEIADDARVVVEVWPFPDAAAERVITAEKALPMYVYTGRALREALNVPSA